MIARRCLENIRNITVYRYGSTIKSVMIFDYFDDLIVGLERRRHSLIFSIVASYNREATRADFSVSWFTGVPCLFHRFDLVVGGRRLLFSLPRIQLRILGSLSAGDS